MSALFTVTTVSALEHPKVIMVMDIDQLKFLAEIAPQYSTLQYTDQNWRLHVRLDKALYGCVHFALQSIRRPKSSTHTGEEF